MSLRLAPLALLLSSCLAAERGPPVPQANVPPKVDPTKLENFTWVDPFSSPKIHQFDAACENSRTFSASEFQLHDLSDPEPHGLLPFKEQLSAVFGTRQYPGSWDGMDPHGYERNLLKMEYKDVPVQVRHWVQGQEKSEGPGKGLFAVIDTPLKGERRADETADTKDSNVHSLDDKIVLFAPGALYETLPLWLAQDSACESMICTSLVLPVMKAT